MMRRWTAVLVLTCMAAALAGCVGGIPATTVEPKLSPPVIARPGVLRAVVDMSYPPFAGKVGKHAVGLDVDVAAAIADAVGLKLELIDAKPAAGAALVATGTADIVLGGLTVEQAVGSQLAFAGTYVADGPAIFAASDTSATPDDLTGLRIAAQTGSLAYWTVMDEYGPDAVMAVPTLAEALKAVSDGKADVAAGDALVGAYMLRDRTGLVFVGQIGNAVPLGIGVSMQKPRLESEVRAVLDRLASEGVLTTLRRKWVGDLPQLTVPVSSVEESAAPSGEASASTETSAP